MTSLQKYIPLEPPKIINGRTMVPARNIAEAFRAEVTWEEDTQTVKISMYLPYNSKYMGLIGKTKPEVDEVLGTCEYIWDNGPYYNYNDSYTTVGFENLGDNYSATEASRCYGLITPAGNFLNGMSSVISKEQLESFFGEGKFIYDERYDDARIELEYCGFKLVVGCDKDGNISPGSPVGISIINYLADY